MSCLDAPRWHSLAAGSSGSSAHHAPGGSSSTTAPGDGDEDEEDGDDDEDDDWEDFGYGRGGGSPLPPKPAQQKAGGGFVPAPLPLINFQLDINDIPRPRTISGQPIKTFRNTFLEPAGQGGGGSGGGRAESAGEDRLQDPCFTRCLSKWFVARSQREVLVRQTETFSLPTPAPGSASAPSPLMSPLRRSDSDGALEKEAPPEVRRASTSNSSSTGGSTEPMPLLDWLVFERSAGGKAAAAPPPCTCSFPTPERHSPPLEGKSSCTGSLGSSQQVYCSACQAQRSLSFASDFESGNLQRATRVENRHLLMAAPRALDFLHHYSAPGAVDHEYDLLLSRDIYTTGNIQWYYFSVTAPEGGKESNITYPLRVRFNLVNMQKTDSLYNVGMKPALLSMREEHLGWRHGKTCDVCYFKNGITSVRGGGASQAEADDKKLRKNLKQYFSLCFTYTFDGPDTVFFAHAFPYTYSDLQAYLHSLQVDERIAQFTRRKLLCSTLAGNRCDVLTITARCSDPELSAAKPAVVVSARIHPGETNSSLAVHGFLEFITSEDPQARALREHFVFKIVPMLNPDGVIHGNYRCSLAGTDLNRRYNDAYPCMYPTVVAMRALLEATHKKRGVLLFLDLHGHSKNKNAFVYGCDVLQMPEKQLRAVLPSKSTGEIATQRVFSRVFPKMLAVCSSAERPGADSTTSTTTTTDGVKRKGFFSFADSSFSVKKNKFGTGRVVAWRQLDIEGSYTIEISFCGVGSNDERRLLKKIVDGKIRQGQGAAEGACGSLKAVLAYCKASGVAEQDTQAVAALAALYDSEAHFSKRNLQQLGEDIGRTIFHFANLAHSDAPPLPEVVETGVAPGGKTAGQSQALWAIASPDARRRDVERRDPRDQRDRAGGKLGPEGALRFGQDPKTTTHGSALFKKPLLGPYLFSGEAFIFAQGTYADEYKGAAGDNLGLRFRVEQELRRTLGLEYSFRSAARARERSEGKSREREDVGVPLGSGSGSGPRDGEREAGREAGREGVEEEGGWGEGGGEWDAEDSEVLETFTINLDAQFEACDDGSDSDPSVDNVPVAKMVREMGKHSSPEALLQAIRVSEGKRRVKEAAAEKAQAASEAKRRKEAQAASEESAKAKTRGAIKLKSPDKPKGTVYSMYAAKRTPPKSSLSHVPVYRLAEHHLKSPVLIQISTLDGSPGRQTSANPLPRPTSVQAILEAEAASAGSPFFKGPSRGRSMSMQQQQLSYQAQAQAEMGMPLGGAPFLPGGGR